MTTRRLAAILAADVVGFSALMGQDEEGTLSQIKSLRREVIEPKVREHHGRVFKTTGDGVLVEFASPVEAVRCAVAIQETLAANVAEEPSRTLQLRIGINLGDILIEEDGDVYGDGVNVAARLEQLAEAGGLCISGKVYEEVRDKLPYAFENKGEQLVKNIARPVRVYLLRDPRTAIVDAAKPLPLPDKPSIAVLPFTNMSGDPEQEYFADGIVEDIITALSRVKWFFVIARNSSFTYKGKAVDIRQVGRELGVRYVLEGSIRRASNRVRITGQLIEATTGRHVWADKFDGSLEDIFDLQDRITESIVGAIEPSLRIAEIRRSLSKATENLDAYDLYMRALQCYYRETDVDTSEALRLLEQAVRYDPAFGLAYAIAANCYAQRVYNNSGDAGRASEIGLRYTRSALEVAADDPEVLWRCAHAMAHFGANVDEYLPLGEKSVALNANSAPGLSQSGWTQIYAGGYSTAVGRFERAIRLSPRDPYTYAFTSGLGVAYMLMEDFGRALTCARETQSLNPNFLTGLRLLAASLALSGRMDDAKKAVADIQTLNPEVRISNLSPAITRSPNARVYIQGLRLAGLPE